MYWYYKLFVLVIIGAVLYGIVSLIGLPELPSFSSGESAPVEKSEQVTPANQVSNKSTTTSKPATSASTPQTATRSSQQTSLTPAQSSILAEATDLFKKKQQLDDAYNKALSLLESDSITLFSKGWYQVADLIGEINSLLIFSSAPSERKINHRVASGDSLSRIARHKTTIRGLQKGNNIPLDSAVIHPGNVLRFFPGEWTIEVVKSEFILMLFHQGKFFKYYKVGTGKENRTPEGEFLIYGKVVDPIWEKPGEHIPPGDPRNVLGTRWMKIQPVGDTAITGSGYGIHGTVEPDSIGTPSSQGCIRMRNDEIEELFDIIPDTKVKVIIRK
jgi:LysM repeat protein